MIARVMVGLTTVRPIIPDQDHRVVLTIGDSESECSLLAAQMVASHPEVEMVTSTNILDLLAI